MADIKQICQQLNYNYPLTIIPERKRIIVFGDIHGDLNLLFNLLEGSRIAIVNRNIQDLSKSQISWIGGDTCLVQTGDQIDRCRPLPNKRCDDPKSTYNDESSDETILNIFNQLGLEAQKTGGLVISLIGNHELMNVAGNMEYVSYKGLEQYKENDNDVEKWKKNRREKFKQGSQIAKMLGCTRLSAVIIGKHLFVHGGIIDDMNIENLEEINVKVSKWLHGLFNDKNFIDDVIMSFDVNNKNKSLFWSRVLSSIRKGTDLTDPVCQKSITKVLEKLHVDSIIVGHTPQFNIDKEPYHINSTCGGKIWRVDTGSSLAFESILSSNSEISEKTKEFRKPQFLEIINQNGKSIYKIYKIDNGDVKEIIDSSSSDD